MTSLVDLLGPHYAPVQSGVLAYIGIREVLALTYTCKAFACLQATLKSTSYNINLQLKPWFHDPQEFRSIQASCNVLIGGRFARQFFTRTTADISLLNLYVDHFLLDTVTEYVENDGYIKVPNNWQYSQEIYTRSQQHGTAQTILLHHYPNDIALGRLLDNTCTTVCLHLISWNKAYSLFPYTTFIKTECYLMADMDEDDYAEECTYLDTKEGIQTKGIHSRQRGVAGDCDVISRCRCIGDKYTWAMILDVDGVRTSEIPDIVLETTTFRLNHVLTKARYHIRHNLLQHPVLKYDFTTLGGCCYCYREECSEVFCRKYKRLKWRLDEAVYIEIMKMPASSRPSNFDEFKTGELLSADLAISTLPMTWKFYDEEVVQYLADAFTEQRNADREIAQPEK